MKPYNIAVCLSGEPRTWKHTAEAIKYFFSSDVHNYKFFGHTWNHSFFNKDHRGQHNHTNLKLKGVADKTDPAHWHKHYNTQTLHSMLTSAFGMTNLLVEDKKIVSDICHENPVIFDPSVIPKFNRAFATNMRQPLGWSHMSYSKMRANALKTQYEVENEMQFDVVVSARYDICYQPDTKFDHLLQHFGTILPTAVYGETHYFPNEFFLPHLNDIMYFGNSRVMNIVDDFYRYFASGKFWELVDEQWTDGALKSCGYGVNLYKWLTIKNILMVTKFVPFGVFRKSAEHLTWPQDWSSINAVNREL